MNNTIIKQNPLTEQEKLIIIFCYVDDLIKHISRNSKFKKISGKSVGRKSTLTLSEVISLGIFRMIVNIPKIKDLLSQFRLLQGMYMMDI
jgi:hypothetical protein